MTSLEELANDDVPGYPVRLAIMKRGAKAERERIVGIIHKEALNTQNAAVTAKLSDLLFLINDRNVL